MTVLAIDYDLVWVMRLSAQGYTVHELVETDTVDALVDVAGGRRWGWIVNAALSGWTAHIGSWGRATGMGMPEPPVDKELKHHPDLATAKSWVEQTIADQWRQRVDGPST